MSVDSSSERVDPVAELKLSWPLDMIATLDPEAEAAGGLLLSCWSDLAVRDLPPSAQTVALGDSPSWRSIASAMGEPEAVFDSCEVFVDALRAQLPGGDRAVRIALARAGLTSDEVPTLEQIGCEWGLTRERVRQIVRVVGVEDRAESALPWNAPLRLALGARLALRPRTPLVIEDLVNPETAQGRIVRLAIETIHLPKPHAGFDLWVESQAQRRAVDALIETLPELLPRVRSLGDLGALAAEALPHVDDTLDLATTLPLLGERLDFGPGLDSRFAFGYAALSRRVAGKTVTYLERRAAPINAPELARAIRKGVPPFEALHRPLVDADWLTDCARHNPDRLQLLADGRIALARRLAHLRPTGNVGILHSILVDHGEPMRMIDLCDRAGHYGMSRNQVGMFIHSGRAACLFILTRGIVGLVGRDDAADPTAYKAAGPNVTRRVRLGEDIGFDKTGKIAADVEVRRSIREQGLGLPWPFSILYFSDRPRLEVDGEHRAIKIRANGDLDLPQLDPGSVVRLRLTVTEKDHVLSVETNATDAIAFVTRTSNGSSVPAGLRSGDDRPSWVDVVLDRAGARVCGLDEVLPLLPDALPARRRLRALYAFVALGFLRPSDSGWATRPQRVIPRVLAEAFAVLRDDPHAYAALAPKEQAASVWLVRATWLVPNVGWTRVRANDLADAGAEDDDHGDSAAVTTSPRETALMRIVEGAYQAADLLRHPGRIDGVEATRTVVRRYLTALGYTAYNAVRAIDRLGPDVISVHRTAGDAATALWLLLPLGSGIEDADVRKARHAARVTQRARAVVTDGLTLVATENGQTDSIDLRMIGQKQVEFDRLAALAADPTSLVTTEGCE